MKKKLSSINLNLLNVLNELLIEKNTTTAAKKLNLSQPSISYSLKQLREIFEDDLLLKSSLNNKMMLTPLAKSLLKPVTKAVQNLENIFRLKDFDHRNSRRQIKIASTDYGVAFFVIELIKRVKKVAPYMSFYTSDLNFSNTKEQLENEDIDIGIGAFHSEEKVSSLKYEFLITDKIVCMADEEHVVSKKKTVSLEDYLTYPHVCVRYPKSGWILTTEELVKIPVKENISAHNSIALLGLLKDSNCLTLGSKRLAEKYSSFYNYSVVEPEFAMPEITISACRHVNRDNDKAVLWIISILKEIAAELTGK